MTPASFCAYIVPEYGKSIFMANAESMGYEWHEFYPIGDLEKLWIKED